MGQAEVNFQVHLHVDTLPKQFALLADAYLEAEGIRMPVHKAVLSAASPVFADLFLAASPVSQAEAADEGMATKPCMPMIGHSATDVQAALQYLYQRVGADHANDSPSKQLWSSVDKARPVLQFAHKYNMQNVLKECDACLTQKAQHNDGKTLFSDFDKTVAWAALADQYDLSYLLAHAELFMVKNTHKAFWSSTAARELSTDSLLRMLQAAQLHMNDWATKSAEHAKQTKEAATLRSQNTYRMTPALQKGSHASVSDLRSWRQMDKNLAQLGDTIALL